MAVIERPASPRRLETLKASLSPDDWRRTRWMFGSILMLHVIGFGIFILFVVPGHYKGLGIGVSVLAYTLGSRHAFDADHISAIDNTTRKLMNDRQDVPGARRPLSVGYWFSLGHSTIVVAIGVGIVIAEKAVYRRRVTPGFRPRAVRRGVRHHRVRDLPVSHCVAQRRHLGGHREGLSTPCVTAVTTKRNSSVSSITAG